MNRITKIFRIRQIATATAIGLLFASVGEAQRRDSRDYDRGVTGEDRWDWNGRVEAGRWVYIRNLNGAVRVEGTNGNTVEVVAYKKSYRRARPSDVRITVEQRSRTGDVVICAIWYERTQCDEDGYRTNSSRDREWFGWGRDDDRGNVNVEFVVRLPRGVKITASSVNGGIEIDGAESEVVAHTTNGGITARSNGGPVSARTTNGSLNIRTGNLGNGTLDYSTTNGGITLEVPDGTSADVEMRTVNGGISSDFPLTIEGRFNTRSVEGRIGRGGQLIRLRTTNGGIQLRKVS
jgi:hypothetical protein